MGQTPKFKDVCKINTKEDGSQANRKSIRKSQEKPSIVDCLVMDDFNRVYNTFEYYPNIFNDKKSHLSPDKLKFTFNPKVIKAKLNFNKINFKSKFKQQNL